MTVPSIIENRPALYDLTRTDYAPRVYAGVLGKMIGVYLGRPIEGMLFRDIQKQFGEINYYVHVARKRELIVTDDDLTGTFTFIRALDDYRETAASLSPMQIGQTWLNYVIENKTIFWWGGVGLSTEHTAFLRLKNGIPAPRSGSIELNSKVVAEQIGSQIFIDAWAMLAPGDPQLAADLARKAASVSHDGEAIYGAQVIAVMESLAFVENDLHKLLDAAVQFIPADSLIARMIGELRSYHAKHPDDWQGAMRDVLEASYGYDRYDGNCHIIPNHGIVILALLYGQDDFARTQMIANTCGWDTDCNAGNVGCLMGIKNGVAGIDAGPDWRGPVADRLMLPTADGGECITDAVRETDRIVNLARRSRGLPPSNPKNNARFHFSMSGSVQGFQVVPGIDGGVTIPLKNIEGRLAIPFDHLTAGRGLRVSTPTFAPPKTVGGNYELLLSPTIYSGQTVTAIFRGDVMSADSISVSCFARYYTDDDQPAVLCSDAIPLSAGEERSINWTVPSTDGRPIFDVGVEIRGEHGCSGTLLLDSLSWTGEPRISFGAIHVTGSMVKRQWVEAVDHFVPVKDAMHPRQAFFAVQNIGRGLAMIGTREWRNYSVAAELTPHLAKAAGLAARVRGLRRYYALLLRHPNKLVLVKMLDKESTFAEMPFDWRWNDDPHRLRLAVTGNRIKASVDDREVFDVVDPSDPIESGGIALVIDEGRLISGAVSVQPAE